ncbi:hypothetical protein [Halorubrum sp. LN27]|uniref:hypothetical protein n=1 Tax=Halorubrum sp. LN27 TaxID=2801032 RepID=UPI00190C7177|nr:hypothetical protein [Halorubrum sp. LN27]
MSSDANDFIEKLSSFKEFSDDKGGHYFVIQFEDDSGRVFKKQASDGNHSIAELEICEGHTRDAMRRISEATDFEFSEDSNTQQNLRHLMNEE